MVLKQGVNKVKMDRANKPKELMHIHKHTNTHALLSKIILVTLYSEGHKTESLRGNK